MNGAGLINGTIAGEYIRLGSDCKFSWCCLCFVAGLYLPPHAVAVQLVPFGKMVNYDEFGSILKARGPYLEWHNEIQVLFYDCAASRSAVRKRTGSFSRCPTLCVDRRTTAKTRGSDDNLTMLTRSSMHPSLATYCSELWRCSVTNFQAASASKDPVPLMQEGELLSVAAWRWHSVCTL